MKINNLFISPHFSDRTSIIDTIVLHYISASNINKEDPYNIVDVVNILTKPIEYKNKTIKVSVHYLIDRDGIVYQLVDDCKCAWHAGKSKMPDGKNVKGSVNDFSIGIELVGMKDDEFAKLQYRGLSKLLKKLVSKYDIKRKNILGHEDVAPKRKIDPGDLFNWDIVDDVFLVKKLKPKVVKPVVEVVKEISFIERIINILISLFKPHRK